MAKKAKAGKRAAKSGKAKGASRKSVNRAGTAKVARKSARKSEEKAAKKSSARKAKPAAATKRTAPTPKPTRASKTKLAARAAATREPKQPLPKKTAAQGIAAIARGLAGTAVAAVTKRLPWAKDENDPILLLQTDHRRFEKLLDEGESTTERAKQGRREILTTLTGELNVHEAIEEKLFYPALQPHAEAKDLVLEGFQEHHVADILIKELHEAAKDDEQWGAKFKVLKENVTHHISDEENKLFPVARGVLPREELLALGARMRALKSELES